ncbi:MAG TPA: long-chain fatty acid--CoA ligase [Spirochaetota bacterium]|nr:long-chain fatty acid--CoA ligase [Spirochaetota bacterium]
MNIIINKFGDSLAHLVRNSLFDQNRYGDSFVEGKESYREILCMAAGMVARFSSEQASAVKVCICTDDKSVMAAAIVASLAGGPDLVLPYSFSEQVLVETREHTGYTAVISENGLEIDGVEILNPADFSGDPASLSMVRGLDSEFLCLFTGGSTGKPKAWGKTVRNVFAEAMYLAKKYSFSSGDKILATVPPYHIYGFLFSVLVPLVSGAVVIERVCTFPREIINAIEQDCPTILVSVPVHYRILKGFEFSGNLLRAAFSSSGPLAPEDGAYFSEMTGVPIFEVYGSTETGGIATRCRYRGETSLRVFDNIDWKITDERLCVRSEFISPALPVDKRGYFTTGDRVEKDGRTSFKLLGRADGIVKIGGKRIDLGEIQEKITGIEGVTDCVIVPLESRNGKEADLAALVEGAVDESVVRDRIKDMVEPYALPRRIKVVHKIPRVLTGKYDRKKILDFFAQ